MNKPIVDIYVLCWNEMKLAPFVVDYWKRIARHVYVYDNGSTDGTIEYLRKFDFITIRHYESDGFNDAINKDVKNECWKDSNADWVWVSDFDECIYSENIIEDIKWLDENGYTVVFPQWIEVISKTNIPEYQDGKLLHELVDGGIPLKSDVDHPSKVLFFKPSSVNKMNYEVGAHTCSPRGDIKMCQKLNTIHFKNLGIEYVLNRYSEYRPRMSKINLEKKWGYHYSLSNNVHEAYINDNIKNAKPIKDILI